ncbi:MAG: diphosphatase [Burkholderiales bacterium]|jgi:NAD+ diphosphatase|nr:diphosphatase [Burkholderiales bacterium]
MLHIIVTQHKILVYDRDDSITLPMQEHIKPIEHMLLSLATTPEYRVYRINDPAPENFPNSLKLINLRQALNYFNDDMLKIIVYYQQLNSYYDTHKFCGVCGTKTQRQEKNKFLICPNCQHEVYPHIAPSIIVRIHKGNDILMARGVNFAPNVWGLIAGFVEVGETLEEAVRREVNEEVGIEIENIRYWGSQPWPFPANSLMVGFTADYKSGEIIIDPVEIEQAGFFNRQNYPGRPSTSYSIASRMLNEYLGLATTSS